MQNEAAAFRSVDGYTMEFPANSDLAEPRVNKQGAYKKVIPMRRPKHPPNTTPDAFFANSAKFMTLLLPARDSLKSMSGSLINRALSGGGSCFYREPQFHRLFLDHVYYQSVVLLALDEILLS